MNRNLVFAIAVLIGLALFVGGTLFERLHDGRCRLSGRSRHPLDCSYPPGTFPKRP
jgi:hypothetical protein